MKAALLTDRYVRDISALQAQSKSAARRQALACLGSLGLPDRSWEDWRYTPVAGKLCSQVKLPPAGGKVSVPDWMELGLAFIDGGHVEKLGRLPAGVSLSLGQSGRDRSAPLSDPFEAINSALSDQVIRLEVAPHTRLSEPLFIAHVASSAAAGCTLAPRLDIVLGEGAKACLFEVFTSGEISHQSFPVSQVKIGKDASLNHVKGIALADDAAYVGKVKGTLDAGACLENFTFCLAGGLIRNNVEVELDGVEAKAGVHGLLAARGRQHHDHYCVMRHNRERTHSEQLFKAILDEQARGVFTGKVVVAKNCPEVDSAQLNKNLLLSRQARIDTRPQLEIDTDDVKCSHGATIGRPSNEETFYLKSRGIPERRVQKILCHAFAAEVVEKIPSEGTAAVGQVVNQLLYDNFERFSLERLDE